MKKIDVTSAPRREGSGYPEPFRAPSAKKFRLKLGDAAGLTQFGVNLLRLKPGVWSSQRHWHLKEDEFVYVLEGEVVLVTDAGEEILKAGDCAGFKANDPDGHHLQNRSDRDVLLLEVGARLKGDGATYPDIDLIYPPDGQPALYTHRDGTPYTDIKQRKPGDD